MIDKTKNTDIIASVMELDDDLRLLYIHYQKQSRRFQKLGYLNAGLGILFILYTLFNTHGLISVGELGSYIGGIAGPFMALAGFFLLFATLSTQKNQTVFQNQTIRNQSTQFSLQSFDNSFFNLLDHYLSFVGKYTIQVKGETFSVEDFKTKLNYWKPYFKEYMQLTGSSADIPSDELKQWLFNEFSNQQNQVKNLFKPLISMLFFIKDAKIRDKEKYYRMLDYQATEAEKFILFYYFITTPNYFTPEEMPVVSTFLKRIDSKTLIHPDHTGWLGT